MAEENSSGPDGLAQLQTLLDAAVEAPIGQTLGFELFTFERRRAVLEGKPNRSVYSLYEPNLENTVLELETRK